MLGVAIGLWFLHQGLQHLIERAIHSDHLQQALFWSRCQTCLWPFRGQSWVQWGNLLGDLHQWPAAYTKFRWAQYLGCREAAQLGMGTAHLALAEHPEDSQRAHLFFGQSDLLNSTVNNLAEGVLIEAPLKKTNRSQLQHWQTHYHTHHWVVIDGLLHEDSVNALRQWCQSPGIWRHHYAGYDGAHLDDGLSHPLIYALACHLIQSLPDIFESQRLMYAWAFRYHTNHEGVRLHHDSAQINVNLWLTPNAYNLQPQTGGLVLYPKNPPASWDLERYSLSAEQMKGLIQKEQIEPLKIPYKQGRLVIFNSRFLHQTEDFCFHRQDPTHRRLNLTLLFGKHPLRYHKRQILPDALYRQGLGL